MYIIDFTFPYPAELVNAISPREKRMKAVNAALKEFSHNDPSQHNQELDLHADKILFQKIAFCYANRKYDEELGLLCYALEMVYRAHPSRVAISFHEIGESLIPLIVDMLKHSAPRRKDILMKQLAAQKEAHELDSISCDRSGMSYTQSSSRSGMSHTQPSTRSGLSQQQSSTRSGLSQQQSLTRSVGSHQHSSTGSNFDVVDTFSRPSIVSAPSNVMTSKTMLSTVSEEKKESFECEEGLKAKFDTIRLDPVTDDITECSTNEESDNISTTVSSHGMSTYDISSQPSKRQVRFSDSIEVDTDAMSTFEKMDGSGKVKIKNTEVTNALAVVKVIRILLYFSRILPAIGFIAHSPGLLDELVFNLRVPHRNPSTERDDVDDNDDQSEKSFHSARISLGSNYSDAKSYYSMDETGSHFSTSSRKLKEKDTDFVSSKGRFDSIAIVVNLAIEEENKTKLLNHPGLLEAVISMAQYDPIFEAREHASIVIMNLALKDSNKVR